MKKDQSRLRQQLRRTEESRRAHIQRILAEKGPLRPGAFVTVMRKCGKPNCHCATGEGHPAKYLSVKEGGRTRMIYIPDHLEVEVEDESRRYRGFRRARAELAKLARRSLEIIDELEQSLRTTEKLGGSKKKGRSASRKPSRKKD